jgi:hypothetical protein
MNAATKFVEFFVNDMLDYAIINNADDNFMKNITVSNINNLLGEVTDTLSDKAKMKGIKVSTRIFGFQIEEKSLVKTD